MWGAWLALPAHNPQVTNVVISPDAAPALAWLVDGHVPRARRLALDALQAATAAGRQPSPDLAALAELTDALFDAMCGRYEAGLARVRAPLERLEARGLEPQLGYAYSSIGFAIGKLGDPQTGLHWVARASRSADRAGPVVARIKALNDEGCLHGLLHHHEQAVRKLMQASTLAQQGAPRLAQVGSMVNLTYALLLQARSLLQQGLASRARAVAQRALAWADRARRAGEPGTEVAPVMLLGADVFRARALLLLDQCDEAQRLLRAALQQVEEVQAYRQVHVEALRAWVALYRQQGRLDEARQHLQRALTLCDEEGYEPVRLDVLEEGIELETEQGEPSAALALWLQHFAVTRAQHRARQRVDGAQGVALADAATLPWPDPRERRAFDAAASWRDPVTGLLNDRGLEAVGQAAFETGGELAVALLRVEGPGPDRATTVRLGRLLAAAWSSGCLAARAVGGTFVVLCPDLPPDRARALCAQLHATLAQALQPAAGPAAARAAEVPATSPTLSGGFAARDRQETLDALMVDAVAALQRALALGGNRFEPG